MLLGYIALNHRRSAALHISMRGVKAPMCRFVRREIIFNKIRHVRNRNNESDRP